MIDLNWFNNCYDLRRIIASPCAKIWQVSETAKHLAEIFLASTLSPKKKPCRYVN